MSLLEQLKLRRSNQEYPGLSLSQSQVGHQKSLLFDSKDAAKIDEEALYLVAMSGLDQLVRIDGRFKPFKATLFSSTARECNRDMLNRERNENLNELIDAFLALLAPYFLLKPAHKVLEYMIRKYRVHKYNASQMLVQFLPYHESLIFLRLVKICSLNDQWSFLAACKFTGKCIARAKLIEHVLANRKLLLAFLDAMKNSVSTRTAYDILHGFYAAMLLQAMEDELEVSESFIRLIWPYILTGLSSRDEQYLTASTIILCNANWKTNISNDLLRSAIDTLFLHTPSGQHKIVISTAVVIVQHVIKKSNASDQQVGQIVEQLLSLASVAAILSWTDSAKILSSLRNDSHIDLDHFLAYLLVKLASIEYTNSHVNFLLELLERTHVDTLPLVVSLLERSDFMRFHAVLSVIRTKFAADFERGLEITMQHSQPPQHLTELLCNTAYHQISVNGQVDTLKRHLSSSDISTKTQALNCLLQIQSAELDSFKSKILLEHLTSQNAELVLNVLQIGNLNSLLSADQLFSSLENTLIQWHSREHESLQVVIFQKLIEYFSDCQEYSCRLQHWIISHLLSSNYNLRLVSLQSLSSLCDSSLVLPLSSCVHSTSMEDILIVLSKIFASQSMDLKIWQSLIDQKSTCWSVFLIIYNSLIICDEFERFALLLNFVWPSISQESILIGVSDTSLESQTLSEQLVQLNINLEKKLLLADKKNFLFVFINNVVLKIKSFNADSNWIVLGRKNERTLSMFKIVYSIFKLLLSLKVSNISAQRLMTQFFSIFNSSIELIVEFLASIWILPESSLDDNQLICKSLNIFCVLVQTCNNTQYFLLDKFANLLVLLLSTNEAVSKMAYLSCKSLHNLFHSCKPDMIHYQLTIKFMADLRQSSLMPVQEYLVNFLDTQDVDNLLLANLTQNVSKMSTSYGKHQVLSVIVKTRNSSLIAPINLSLLESILNGIGDDSSVCAEITYDEQLINMVVSQWDRNVALLASEKEEYFGLLMKCLHHKHESKDALWSVRRVVLQSINSEFYMGLSTRFRVLLLENLCDFIVVESSVTIRDLAKQVLDALPLESEFIVKELEECCTHTIDSQDEPVVKMIKSHNVNLRPKNVHFNAENGTVEYLMVLLEFLQRNTCTDVRFNLPFIKTLFALLKNTFDSEHQLNWHASSSYIQQLLFNKIISISQSIVDCLRESNELTDWLKNELIYMKSYYDVDSVVRNIGINDNPILHNNALLLLGNMALIYPEKVVDNIINIFSLIGTSIERSDDSYTFTTMEKILECIIPTLINNQPTCSPVSLIETFVHKLHAIPIHRALVLFTHLLKKILPIEYFSLVMILILLEQNEDLLASDQQCYDSADTDFSFLLSLCHNISPRKSIAAIIYAIYWFMKFEEKICNTPLLHPECKINQIVLMPQARVVLAAKFLDFLCSYMTSKQLITQLIDKNQQIQKSLIAFFQSLLAFSNYVSKNSVLIEKNYLIMDQIYQFINLDTYFAIVKATLNQGDSLLKNRMLLVFNEKLANIGSDIKFNCVEGSVYTFLEFIVKILKSTQDKDEELVDVSNQQIALQSVQIVSRQFGHVLTYKDHFLTLLTLLNNNLLEASAKSDRLVNNARLQSYYAKLKSSIVISIGVLCSSMRENAISEINNVFPTLIETLEKSFSNLHNKHFVLLQKSCLNSISLIFQSIPLFLSGYLEGLLKLIIFNMSDRLSSIVCELFKFIGLNMPMRVLFKPMDTMFNSFFESNHLDSIMAVAVEAVIGMLVDSCSIMDAVNIKIYNQQVFNVFLKIFRLIEHILNKKNSITIENLQLVQKIQTFTVEGYLKFLLKLNETQFNPMFKVMIDWAGVLEEETCVLWNMRLCLFYQLLLTTFTNLRSIFVPYFDSVLQYTVEHVIGSVNVMVQDQCKLRQWQSDVSDQWHIPINGCLLLHSHVSTIFDLLKNYFAYDTNRIFNEEKFERFMPILVDHFDSVNLEAYEDRIEMHLVPCLVQMISYSSEAQCKSFTKKLLSKVHHPNHLVRNGVVSMLSGLYKKMGEAYLQFLPDSLQTLNFLLEDSNKQVISNTLKLIKHVELLLGKEDSVMSLLTK